MNMLKNIDSLSFGKILSLSLVIAIIIAVPVGVVIIQKETRIGSRAAYEKPQLATQPKATPGPIPQQAPFIGRVYPWVGKIGDIVWLQGQYFGSNPINKSLAIGGIPISDNNIEAWEDTQIQTLIPKDAKQGGIVELTIGDYPTSQSLPFVLYDQNTKTKLRKKENIISIENGDTVSKAVVWTGDNEIETAKHEGIVVPENGKAQIFDTQGLPLLSIILLDSQGKIVPYYVDPLEFGF